MVRLVGCVIAILMATIMMAVVAVVIYKKGWQLSGTIGFWIALAFLIRLVITIGFSFSEKSTHTDMIYWVRWTSFFQTHRFSEYYSQHVGDYTPGFMYWLKFTATILNMTGCSAEGTLAQLLYKLPAMLTDCLSGGLVYLCARKRKWEKTFAITCAALFLFHPTVIFLTAVWGQVDVLYTFFIALTFYLLYQGKVIPSAFTIGLAIIIKLQTVFVGPVYIVIILMYLFGKLGISKGKNLRRRFAETVMAAIIGIGVLIMGCIPGGITEVFVQVTRTMSQYRCASLNAANFWTFIGLNMKSQDDYFLGISYAMYGYGLLVLAIFLAIWFTFHAQDESPIKGNWYIVGAWMYVFIFTFTVRMHERYIYPALLLWLCAYAVNQNKKCYISYILFSLTCFVNFTTFITIEKYHGTFNLILWLTSIVVVVTCLIITVQLLKKVRRGRL